MRILTKVHCNPKIHQHSYISTATSAQLHLHSYISKVTSAQSNKLFN